MEKIHKRYNLHTLCPDAYFQQVFFTLFYTLLYLLLVSSDDSLWSTYYVLIAPMHFMAVVTSVHI